MNKSSQLQFAHRASLLLESGISLSEMISIIMKMEKSKKSLKIYASLLADVEKGISLARSFSSLKLKLDPVFFSMISFGERSGILPQALKQAYSIMEKGEEIKRKLIGALIYPAFIALATLGMTLFLVMYIFPKIVPLFSTLNIQVPLLTRFVQELYVLLLHYGIISCCFLSVAVGVLYYLIKIKKERHVRVYFEKIVLSIPIVGNMMRKYFVCNYCRTISTLTECGQLLPSILEQVATASTYLCYKNAWGLSRIEIERGIALSVSLGKHPRLFSPLVCDMISIGERTGSLSAMFLHLSKMYESELEDFIKHLSTSIEPVLMMVMGVVVGSVALSIILPIYEITNHLSN